MKIILLGYMGSGKSTIGRLIASKKNFSFIDLDNYIEEKENKTVAEIFETKGEIYFRKKEDLYLKEILNLKQEIVLALGGGTPCYGNNMEYILNDKTAKTVYLKTSINTIVARLINEKSQRPLVARLKQEELHEFVAKHLFERSYFYNQSEYKITVDNKNVHEIVAELNKIV
ncbi:shikimate kinase [Tenacibaculum piscium]|uniref:Shikimate kinase n=1 Tax=Tenacibaculum piscium TaxID=1458515 RepID=A0A2H1YJD8_9FLAO|nr:shikimate kinase [Tenacibaculum piscium]MBE7630437.1 shikimate kinase [Tenacibaculum piscium]MBE7671451.1 shikimate kinase [Tenacibaculum piscium]MBE7686117.1 shikimate kinase [Tenacibaculum piscium]MCG8184376.1 shikimate kinase [Tenacibaculum piscium]MCG8205769.1 shikimate kinase [Tenacibaculum piscium]